MLGNAMIALGVYLLVTNISDLKKEIRPTEKDIAGKINIKNFI
jgi:hypothetical protein